MATEIESWHRPEETGCEEESLGHRKASLNDREVHYGELPKKKLHWVKKKYIGPRDAGFGTAVRMVYYVGAPREARI